MQPSLEQLMTGVIDYAGMFPPTKFSAEEALAEYRKWRGHDFGFTVNRFCCTAERLGELAPFLEKNEGLVIAAIGKACDGAEAWNAAREQEAAAMNAFEAANQGKAEIGAYEVFVPTADLLQSLVGFSNRDVFAEVALNETVNDLIAAAAELDWLALKARTGGTNPGTVPPASRLAAFIWECLSLDVPFKLTAGLHHPMPNENVDTKDHQHGFVNVVTASALAYAQNVPASALVTVLEDEDASHWVFGNSLKYGTFEPVSSDELEATRELFTGFGSCSVGEPFADLKTLLWA